MAGRLAAVGIRAGEHIAIYKSANFDVMMLAIAAARLGAVPVMLSPALDAKTVGILLERLGRPQFLCDLPKLEAMAGVPLADIAEQVILATGSAPGAVSLDDFAGAEGVKPVFRAPTEPAMITHTSGTTGVPKLVVHTARTMGTRLRPQWWLLSLMWKRDTVAINIPFVHSRMYAAMALTLLKATPVLLMKNSAPDKVAELFAKHRPGFIEALPNALMEWEELADDPRRPFANIKYFSSTFDAIHPRTIDRLVKSSDRRGAMFFQIYGQSEVGPAVGRPYFRGSGDKMDGRCVGFPMPGCARVRVVSRNGKQPSRTNPGFIETRWRASRTVLRRAGAVRRQQARRLVADRRRGLPHQARLPAHARPGSGHGRRRRQHAGGRGPPAGQAGGVDRADRGVGPAGRADPGDLHHR